MNVGFLSRSERMKIPAGAQRPRDREHGKHESTRFTATHSARFLPDTVMSEGIHRQPRA
jgi:hypothetical protein